MGRLRVFVKADNSVATRLGDHVASRKAYEGFFALWKNAGPAIPVVVEAKAEYAALS